MQRLNKVLGAKWPRFPYKLDLDVGELSSLMSQSYESPEWDALADICLACGQCTLVCPTCFCFNVYDEVELNLQDGERRRNVRVVERVHRHVRLGIRRPARVGQQLARYVHQAGEPGGEKDDCLQPPREEVWNSRPGEVPEQVSRAHAHGGAADGAQQYPAPESGARAHNQEQSGAPSSPPRWAGRP